jgi:hypothetical protein
MLPEGGRLLLEPVDAQGKPLPGACGVGFTFVPASRGVTLHRMVQRRSVMQSGKKVREAIRNRTKGLLASAFREVEDDPRG